LINKTLLFALLGISIIFAQPNRKDASIYFKETRLGDSISWQKIWTEFIIYQNPHSSYLENRYSLIEVKYNDKWYNFKPFSNEHDYMSITTIKWDYKNKGYNSKVWQLNDTGCKSEIISPFFVVTRCGCCDHPNKNNYYSMKSGNFVIQTLNRIDFINRKQMGEMQYIGAYLNRYVNNERYFLCYLISDTSIISTIEIPIDSSFSGYPNMSNLSTGGALVFDHGKKIEINVLNDKLLFNCNK
jgi:hypothetical protein